MTEPRIKDRAANLGQLYGIVSSISRLAESAKSISGLCFGPVHTEFLAMMEKQAEAMCNEIRDEHDKMKEPIDPWRLHNELYAENTKEIARQQSIENKLLERVKSANEKLGAQVAAMRSEPNGETK